MILSKDGSFELFGDLKLSNYAGTQYGGIVSYNMDGVLTGIKFSGNSDDVLLGNGTFSNSAFSKYWKLDGDNIFNANIGNVGIGTSTPQALLDVNGNSIIRGTLFVYNGIIVGTRYEGEKVDVDTIISKEMEVTEKFKVQTINIDGINSKITSTTGLIDFGSSNLKTSAVMQEG